MYIWTLENHQKMFGQSSPNFAYMLISQGSHGQVMDAKYPLYLPHPNHLIESVGRRLEIFADICVKVQIVWSPTPIGGKETRHQNPTQKHLKLQSLSTSALYADFIFRTLNMTKTAKKKNYKKIDDFWWPWPFDFKSNRLASVIQCTNSAQISSQSDGNWQFCDLDVWPFDLNMIIFQRFIGEQIQWPNMQTMFKFQVNWMKIDDFIWRWALIFLPNYWFLFSIFSE